MAAKKQQKTAPKPQPKKVTPEKVENKGMLPEKVIDYYSDDNDNAYKEYRPRRINKSTVQAAKPQPEKVIFVPVPVPSYDSDNDSAYKNVGEYNPNPLNYSAPAVEAPSYDNSPDQIPVPTPSSTEDFDNQDSLYYYQ